jgi:BMFP domain-containing protein YqiC
MGKFILRGVVRVGLAIAGWWLSVMLFSTPAFTQSLTGLDSRVSRVESQNTVIEARLNQLENQISRIGQATGIRVPTSPPLLQGQGIPRGTLSADPMFNRLATLAIEQKERMDQLEARLNAIEARLSGRSPQ